MNSYRIKMCDDGFWYLDAKMSGSVNYKPHSRHATLDEALAKIKQLQEENTK